VQRERAVRELHYRWKITVMRQGLIVPRLAARAEMDTSAPLLVSGSKLGDSCSVTSMSKAECQVHNIVTFANVIRVEIQGASEVIR